MAPKIFISYKSEDAVAVRMIAEQLRAQGASVWFAEYDVTISKRAEFQVAIDTAIAECDYGLCFTNDVYAGSEYCRDELEKLLRRLPPERIVEVGLPGGDRTHGLFPTLSSSPFLEVPVTRENGHSGVLEPVAADRILGFVSETTGIPLGPCGYECPEYVKRLRYQTHGLRYSLDFAGWSMKKPGILPRLIAWRSLGPVFERYSPDGSFMWGKIMVGKMDAGVKRFAAGEVDDRAYYKAALAFADSFFANVQPQHCIGAHLVFTQGWSHPAFTTIKKGAGMAIMMGRQTWRRLYSIVVSGPRGDMEFAFFFFVRGRLESFLRCAHIMDHLVLSLEQG